VQQRETPILGAKYVLFGLGFCVLWSWLAGEWAEFVLCGWDIGECCVSPKYLREFGRENEAR